MRVCNYLQPVLDSESRQEEVARAAEMICKHFPEAEAIAFTGLSGALIAPELATRLGLRLLAVRKEETKHSDNMVEVARGIPESVKYVVVDDLIDSGTTICRMHNAIQKSWPEAELLGAWLYYDYALYTATQLKQFVL